MAGPMTPEFFYDNTSPKSRWYQDVMAWNQNRDLPMYPPQHYGLFGEGRDPVMDQRMIDSILGFMLSPKGVDAYRLAITKSKKRPMPPTPTPTPTPRPPSPVDLGIDELKKKKKKGEDSVSKADEIESSY